MGFSITLIFLISHIAYDFSFQGEDILKLRFPKGNNIKERFFLTLKGNCYHCLYHFIGTLILFFLFKKIYGQDIPLLYILIYSVVHFIIDEFKSILILYKPYLKENLKVFLYDQLIHVLSIFIICNKFINLDIINENLFDFPNNLNFLERFLIAVLVVLISTFFAAIFLKIFIHSLNNRIYKNLSIKNFYIPKFTYNNISGAKNGGYLIGILERAFIILVISLKQPAMIGVVLTAKSIARFKKMEDESFAEYFIIGTFISFIFAIIGGVIILKLNIMPLLD